MQIIKKMQDDDMYITIAVIANSHGLNGSIKIKTYSDNFLNYEKIYIKEKGIYTPIKFEITSISKDIIIAKVAEIKSKEEALKFKNKKLYIHQDQLEKLKDEHYIRDLIGLDCFDENNQYLGKIVDIMLHITPEIFVIEKDKKEICIPNSKEYVILLDEKNKKCKFNIEKLRGIF